MFTQRLVHSYKSPIWPLITEDALAASVARLRDHLAVDTRPDIVAALADARVRTAQQHWWWQRLPIPGTSVFTTTAKERFVVSHPGWLNTLGDALTAEEGFFLRPMPKWAYIKRLLPDIADKTVLEIGCNNGYFCFEFAKMNARSVTGYEVFEEFARSGQWHASEGGYDNVEIIAGDALLDLTLQRHDIVFMSEVHGHFVDPLFGISRAVNLAKEWLVIDGAAHPGDHIGLEIGGGIDTATGKLDYHSWIMSDGLMLTYLFLCGVPPERVHRYIAPWHDHIMYVIDTSEVDRFRDANRFQACNTSFIQMNFKQ
jgi:2-polyprenyl-3-methyl-5-hydroxy-6-metoxy-1,4-benzoquinol methylase